MSRPDDYEEIFPRPLSGAAVPEPPPGLVPARIPLEGTHVTLEPLNAGIHAAEMFEASHRSDEALKIWDYLTYGPFSDLAAFTASAKAHASSLDPVFYAIRSKETGKACGQASFLDIQPQNGVTEIGHIWFAPDLQRTRGATEALFLMLCHAMDDLGYRRMQWRCNATNAKSRAAARRLGFRFEGIFYNALIFKGKNRDTAWYSILDDEWLEVRERIAAWLDASNFDKTGQARTSLSWMMQDRTPSQRGQ